MNISEQLLENFQPLKKESDTFFKLIDELQKLEKNKQKKFTQIKENIAQLITLSEKKFG